MTSLFKKHDLTFLDLAGIVSFYLDCSSSRSTSAQSLTGVLSLILRMSIAVPIRTHSSSTETLLVPHFAEL